MLRREISNLRNSDRNNSPPPQEYIPRRVKNMGLVGISPIISPDLLATLARMGHGDSICFADANFPCESQRIPVIRADGHDVASLLRAVAKLFPLDSYSEFPVKMMAPVAGDSLDPAIEERFGDAVEASQPDTFKVERVERFAFYDLVKSCFAVVATGETVKYGNIVLVKGVLGVSDTGAGGDIRARGGDGSSSGSTALSSGATPARASSPRGDQIYTFSR